MSDVPDRVPDWCEGVEWCQVTAVASLISRKWKPVIIDQLLKHRALGFSELQDAIGEISGKALSNNLKELEDDGLVERKVVSVSPYRVEYSLTDPGRDLEPIIREMRNWSENHLNSPSDDEESQVDTSRA